MIFHRHRFIPVATTPVPTAHGETPYTTVLFRCNCTEVKTKDLRGDWTVADLAGGSQPSMIDLDPAATPTAGVTNFEKDRL